MLPESRSVERSGWSFVREGMRPAAEYGRAVSRDAIVQLLGSLPS